MAGSRINSTYTPAQQALNRPFDFKRPTINEILALDPALYSGLTAYAEDVTLLVVSDGVNWINIRIRTVSSGFSGFITPASVVTMSATALVIPQALYAFTTEAGTLSGLETHTNRPAEETILNTDPRITAHTGTLPVGAFKKLYISYNGLTGYGVTDAKVSANVNEDVHFADFFVTNNGGVIEYAVTPDPNIVVYPSLSQSTVEDHYNLYDLRVEDFALSILSIAVGVAVPEIGTYKCVIEGVNYSDYFNSNRAVVTRDTALEKQTVHDTDPINGVVSTPNGIQTITAETYWDTDTQALVATKTGNYVTVLIYVDYYFDAFGDSNGIVYTVPWQALGANQGYATLLEAQSDLDAYLERVIEADVLEGCARAFVLFTKKGSSDVADTAVKRLTGGVSTGSSLLTTLDHIENATQAVGVTADVADIVFETNNVEVARIDIDGQMSFAGIGVALLQTHKFVASNEVFTPLTGLAQEQLVNVGVNTQKVLGNGKVEIVVDGVIEGTVLKDTDFGSVYAPSASLELRVADNSYDVSTASFTQIALDVSPQETSPRALLYNDDGTKLYVIGITGDDINEYLLAVPYRPKTVISTQIALTVSGQETSPQGLAWNEDGTKLYVIGDAAVGISEYAITTPYNIALTDTFTQLALDVSAQEVSPRALKFNNDGTKLYVLGNAGNDVGEWSVAIPFSIQPTDTFTQIALDVSGQETSPQDFTFNGDGKILYVLGAAGMDVSEYALATPGEIVPTDTFTQIALSVSAQETVPTGMIFSGDGSSIYVIGITDMDVNEYTMVTKYDVANGISLGQALYVGAEETTIQGMLFNDDGTKLYTLGNGGDDINEYALAVPYRVQPTDIFTQIALDVSAQEANPRGMLFNGDGTKLYVLGITGDDINEYAIATPFNIQPTDTFTQIALDVSAQETEPRSMMFNGDGTKLYVLGSAGDDINEYALATPFNIAPTDTHTQIALDISPQDTFAADMVFSGDGTKLYVLGDAGDDISEYALATPFNIQPTDVFTQIALSIVIEGVSPIAVSGLLFSPDGSELYVCDPMTDTIQAYAVTDGYAGTALATVTHH